MSGPIIRVEKISKRYEIGAHIGVSKSLSDQLQDFISHPIASLQKLRLGLATETLWALKDVSFDVQQGEIVGLIGRNGAGKSTLLKILSRITEPTEGMATIRGRIGSLLEVGIGFHPDLTGRENVYLYGIILGMTKAELDRKFEEIVAFGGVEKFIDTAMKYYSSGMYVRLAFAVAAHLEPDVLLIDEVLAVGDADFQSKCLGRIDAIAREGRTVLFVSHNIPAVLSLCRRAILLTDGRVTADGAARPVLDTYLEGIREKTERPLCERKDRRGDGRARFTSCQLKDSSRVPIDFAMSGQDIILALGYESADGEPVKNMQVVMELYGKFHESLCQLTTNLNQVDFHTLPPRGEIELIIPRLPLQAGHYMFDLYMSVSGGSADYILDAGNLQVEPGDFFGTGHVPNAGHGVFLVPHAWGIAQSTDLTAAASEA